MHNVFVRIFMLIGLAWFDAAYFRFQSQDTESAYIEEMAQRLATLQGIDNSQSAMPTIHGQMMRGLHGHGGYYPSMNESSSGGRGSGGSFRGGSGGRYASCK